MHNIYSSNHSDILHTRPNNLIAQLTADIQFDCKILPTATERNSVFFDEDAVC
jgi:hypothetical protein